MRSGLKKSSLLRNQEKIITSQASCVSLYQRDLNQAGQGLRPGILIAVKRPAVQAVTQTPEHETEQCSRSLISESFLTYTLWRKVRPVLRSLYAESKSRGASTEVFICLDIRQPFNSEI